MGSTDSSNRHKYSNTTPDICRGSSRWYFPSAIITILTRSITGHCTARSFSASNRGNI
uniref:Uncharacterized protein n=1 Tax=uncultured marine virus TaxID=186617 RepID=A0A0F7L2C5_9VIRU|nr:hypothetical protein [uncultured marine virus]